MVRLNNQSNFQFPFLASDSDTSTQVSKATHLDFADSVLSIFAITFFFAILLAITLDDSNPKSHSDTNTIAKLEPQVENIMPLAILEKAEKQIKETATQSKRVQPTQSISTPVLQTKIKKQASDLTKSIRFSQPKILENKKLDLNLTKKEITSKSQILPKVQNYELKKPKIRKIVSVPVFPKETTIEKFEEKGISKPIEITPLKDIHLNQSKFPIAVKTAIEEQTTKTTTVSPKPVFVENRMDAQDLVINKNITDDLLPLSYFHAKEKAESEGKLLYIKFGAKWCLPCRQMEKTTFKDERVKDFSDENYVSLAVDVDDFDGVNMQAYFNVKTLPTILVFNSQGNFLAKYMNFQTAESMLNILEKHKSEQEVGPMLTSNEVTPSPKIGAPKVEKIASLNFNKITLSKKRDGEGITQLKSKAKNWRYTQLDFSTKNINKGELLLMVKETYSGLNLTKLNIPVIKNQGIADTTTTNFQLVLEHEKRKKKNGEYVMEIFHVAQNDTMLVGKTTLLKDGEIRF